MVFLKNVLIWRLYLKTDPMNCNRLNRRRRRQRRQRRCAEVSHHEFETTKGFGTILSGLARSVLCVFFILFHVCTLSWLFWESLRFHVLWSIFYIMMDESSFHQCRSSKFHIYMSRPTWDFFLKQSSEDCWFFCRFPENWATGFPVKYWDFQRFRWFPSDSDELRGSEKIFRSEVLTISKLRNSDIFRWFHGQKNRPQKKGPDVMDSRDLNQPGNGNQKN
jgi:hypothetical protein